MYYVYVDYTSDGRPFYVGKGNRKRVSNLIRNNLHENIVKKHGQVRKIVNETSSEKKAFNIEIDLIKQHKTKHGENDHWGANLTWGGEGTSGAIHSLESKEKRRRSLTGRKLSEEHKQRIRAKRLCQIPPMLGKKFSVDHRQRISESLKDNPKLKRAPVNRGQKLSLEQRLKIDNSYKQKSVDQFTLDNVFIRRFLSLKEAAVVISKYERGISASASGKRNNFAGFIWKWVA